MSKDGLRPFHVAFPVRDLEEAERFYADRLGCEIGRRDQTWIDFNLYGHQIVAHLRPGMDGPDQHQNDVDGHHVPVPHFGVVLELGQWKALAERLQRKQTTFVIDPYIRFEGETGEHATLFFLDPSGNALEFKAFKNLNDLFAA